ncbi:MAG: O-antigen ligase family protein [Pirellulaceae bacterium]|nr:O-antigen ligase family protein [Planctomycetales bacterium]
MTLFAIIAAIVGLVWGTYFVLRGSLVVGSTLYLIVASVLGYDFLHFDVGGISMSMDRLLLLWAIGSFAVQWRLGRTTPKPITRDEIIMFSFFGLLCFNTFTHDFRNHDPGQVPIVQHLINGYLIPLILYWIVRQSTVTRRDVEVSQLLMIVFGVYLAFTAFFEVTQTWSMVFPKYIADPTIGIHFGRARGPFLQSVRLGVYLTAAWFMAWMLLNWQGRFGRRGQLIGIVLLPIFLGSLYVTYTRSVWMGVALIVALTTFATLHGRTRWAAIACMMFAGLAVVAVKGDKLVSFQREYSAAETRESTSMRGSFAYVSWLMFKERPISGFGFGHFSRENQRFLNDRALPLRHEAIRGYIHHNTFLSLLVDLGLFGLLLYGLLLYRWGRGAWQLWCNQRAPDWMRSHGLLMLGFMIAYMVQMLFHEVSYSPMENGILYLLAGLTAALRSQQEPAMSTPRATGQFESPSPFWRLANSPR